MLGYVCFKNSIRHANQVSLLISLLLVQIITIVTVQVTECTNRFGENLKVSGCFNHCPTLNSGADSSTREGWTVTMAILVEGV